MHATIRITPYQAPGFDALRLRDLQHHCADCSLCHLCLPHGLSESEMLRLDRIIGRRRRIARNAILYRMDDPFIDLYAVKVGHFKTQHINIAGTQQITGFHMPGEMMAMDGIASGRHPSDAVALEDSEVCEIPYIHLEALFAELPALRHQFHRLMSQEVIREQNHMLLLGSMTAEQRLAAFLINLGSRYAARGYSSTRFRLHMMREDMANHLGLTIESVSRLLTRFRKAGYLRVTNRDIEIISPASLSAIMAGSRRDNGLHVHEPRLVTEPASRALR